MKSKSFNRNALILSSSKGIGYGISRNLLSNHYNVIITSSSLRNLKNSQIKLKKETGFKPYIAKLDLSNIYNLKKNLNRIIRIFNNKIDIYFC